MKRFNSFKKLKDSSKPFSTPIKGKFDEEILEFIKLLKNSIITNKT
jgi:hypothetical protein